MRNARPWLLGDRAAELLPLLRIDGGLVEGCLSEPGCGSGDPESAGVERRQRHHHALALLADPARSVDRDAVEDDLRDRIAVQAHLPLRLGEGQAPGVSGDDERGEALAARVGGADKGRVVVGVPRMGDPRLGALEGVARPVVGGRGPGRHRRDVRARERLGEAVGAELVAGEHPGQERLLLLLGAVHGDGMGRQAVDADTDGDAHPHRGDLLDDLEVDLVGLPRAAVLLRIGEGKQARPAEGAEDLLRERVLALGLVHQRRELLAADLAGQLDEVGGFVGGHQPRRWHGPDTRTSKKSAPT